MIKKIHKALPWLILAFGALLRIAQFASNRSVTEGEAALALNIIGRSFAGLLKPLDLVQAAPYGFLVVQRAMLGLFGNHDYTLRIIPLAAGLASLALFWRVSKRLFRSPILEISLLLFAVSDYLIYFASELKQYSTDVAVCLLITWLVLAVLRDGFDPCKFFGLAVCAGLGIWFSHPAAFAIAGAGIVLLVRAVERKDRDARMLLPLLALVFFASFTADYFLTLRSLSAHPDFLSFWGYSFLPLPPRSAADLKWFGVTFLRVFKNPGGFPVYLIPLAGAFFLLGFRMARARKFEFWALALPVLLALAASGFHKYPFDGRLLLFTLPFMIALISAGVETVSASEWRPARIVGWSLALLMAAPLLAISAYRLFEPRRPEELRPVMKRLQSEYRAGDVVYLYYGAVNSYDYYARQMDFHPAKLVRGVEAREDWNRYYADLKALPRARRVWIVFSHIANWGGVDEERIFLDYLDRLGRRTRTFKAPGAGAYLYDLTRR